MTLISSNPCRAPLRGAAHALGGGDCALSACGRIGLQYVAGVARPNLKHLHKSTTQSEHRQFFLLLDCVFVAIRSGNFSFRSFRFFELPT